MRIDFGLLKNVFGYHLGLTNGARNGFENKRGKISGWDRL
jgi:hypothetical protein